MDDCIFCKIAKKEIPSEIIFEDNKIIAFKDITPIAPTHILIIPKEHISSLNDLTEKNIELVGNIMLRIKEIAEDIEIDGKGYRVVNNCGKYGGQTVEHLHFHLIAGRQMQWPPG